VQRSEVTRDEKQALELVERQAGRRGGDYWGPSVRRLPDREEILPQGWDVR